MVNVSHRLNEGQAGIIHRVALDVVSLGNRGSHFISDKVICFGGTCIQWKVLRHMPTVEMRTRPWEGYFD